MIVSTLVVSTIEIVITHRVGNMGFLMHYDNLCVMRSLEYIWSRVSYLIWTKYSYQCDALNERGKGKREGRAKWRE